MKTENLNEFLKLMQKINPISDAHKAAMIHKGISNEIQIEFKTYEEGFEISSSYMYGAAHIHIDNKECIVLDYDSFEASAFDWGDQITLNANDDCVYFKVFEDALVDCTLDAVTGVFSFCWDDFEFEYIINDEDDAKAAYFQISTMFSDDLVTEEEFVNQFIAYFKLKEITITINKEFCVQICLSNDSGLAFSNFLNNLKFPKVEFV